MSKFPIYSPKTRFTIQGIAVFLLFITCWGDIYGGEIKKTAKGLVFVYNYFYDPVYYEEMCQSYNFKGDSGKNQLFNIDTMNQNHFTEGFGNIEGVVIANVPDGKALTLHLSTYRSPYNDSAADSSEYMSSFTSDSIAPRYFNFQNLPPGTYNLDIPSISRFDISLTIDSIMVIPDSTSVVVCHLFGRSPTLLAVNLPRAVVSWHRWIVPHKDSLWYDDIIDSIMSFYY